MKWLDEAFDWTLEVFWDAVKGFVVVFPWVLLVTVLLLLIGR